MIKILFVCHGNICRSPMAEFIMKRKVKEAGLERQFLIASAATSYEEIGNPVYPPARRKLAQYGISCSGKQAVHMEKSDYGKYDYLIGMEQYNIRNMMRILGSDPEGKVSRLLDFTDAPADIDDPWYTGDFETTYREISAGCDALLDKLVRENKVRG